MSSREIGVEEPVHFYARTAQGAFKTISLRVIKSTSPGSEPYQLACVDSSEHGRSWGAGGMVHDFSCDDGCRATFALDRVGITEHFRLNTQLAGQ